jgi:hypothetical protein
MWKKATVKERSIWKKTSISGPICGNVLWILPGAIIDIATGGRLGGPAHQSASERIRTEHTQ